MEIDVRMVVEALAFLAFTGWNLVLMSMNSTRESDKAALQKEVDTLNKWKEDFTRESADRWEKVLSDFVTKSENALVRAELLGGMERLEKKLDRALELQAQILLGRKSDKS